MNLEAILDDIKSLPPEKQEEVIDFIAFLKGRVKKLKQFTRATSTPGKSTESNGFIGMWADRPEMEDSSKWVHELRANEWKQQDA